MVHILHFSSHYEDCGIAKYQENYLKAMAGTEEVDNDFFAFSPYQTREMNVAEYDVVMTKLQEELKKYDILHIQHEFGFYRGKQLEKMVDVAKAVGVKVVITFHTSPDLIIIKKRLTGLGPHSIVSFLRSYRHNYILSKMHIAPANKADQVLVHNQYTLQQLVNYGVNPDKLLIIPHPTLAIAKPPKTTFIAKALNKKPGDVIMSTIGYLHRFKGVDKAIKALQYLPAHYKLAVIGGVKSDSDDHGLYDKFADLIIKLGLKDRVYITGIVADDDTLNGYIQETDFCLYPYSSAYYKGVGSGSLNLAIANEKPIIAYPVLTFVETNQEFGQLVLTGSDSYYELARRAQEIDLVTQKKKIIAYAKANSWNVMAQRLIEVYKLL